MALSASRRETVPEQTCAFEDVVGNHRKHHVQLETAGLSGDRDRSVVADDLRADHRRGFGNDRVDLAGHDAASGLQRRQRDVGDTGLRSLFIQRRSFPIFMTATAPALIWPLSSTIAS